MFLALKEMMKEKTRFIMIILITALIAYLVYFLSSLAYGLAQINRTAIDYWQTEGIIIDKSANGNIYASSIDESEVKELDITIDKAINVTSTTIYVNQDEEPINLIFLGFDGNNQVIVPNVIEGRMVEKDNEIIISSNIKNESTIKLMDTIKVTNTEREFQVVGFTDNSNYNTVPVAYVHQEMASSAMMVYKPLDSNVDITSGPTPNMPKRFSAILANETVSEEKLNNYGLEYIDINTFISGLPGYQAQVLTFGLMIISLSLIASIIIGIFMYILTMQKRGIFAVLKIQGYRNSYIMKSVIYQTLILVVIGFMVGLGFTIVTLSFLPSKVPAAINWPLYLAVSGFAIGSSLLGAIFSAKSILKIDPLDAL